MEDKTVSGAIWKKATKPRHHHGRTVWGNHRWCFFHLETLLLTALKWQFAAVMLGRAVFVFEISNDPTIQIEYV